MFTGKMAALCLCPALIATPAVIATHPKMRHAVAHVMHRAADGLEAPVAAAEPLGHCPASYANDVPSGGGQSSGAPAGLSGLAPQDMSALQSTPFPTQASDSFARPGSSFSNAPTSGIGGAGSPAADAPGGPGTDTGVVTPPAPAEGVTEPQNWALLMTGFAATGLLLRSKRLKTV